MLIEMEGDFLLVGIGCNVMTAPEVASTGIDGGRTATCLREHNVEIETIWREYQQTGKEGMEEIKETLMVEKAEDFRLDPVIGKEDIHKKLTVDIVKKFKEWIENQQDDDSTVIEDFSRRMDYSMQRRRDLEEGKNVVIPLGLNPDGTLQVRVSFIFFFCKGFLTPILPVCFVRCDISTMDR
jgi:hypothetical protein